ncbi:unnamed protein product [Hermetia illucens]|uniref:G-protein coupled receptors family 1 profile domain-containing protein n=1 Tax=Hermetia illucens TaxID=343691 RepID=A0A7R8YV47_HERIL|nr:pinopsin-like [Hermetia illucens]CAD7086887.1 unnamed protein product [Hermetia illucens]
MDVSINSSTIIANYKDGQLMEPWGYLLAAAVLLLIGLVGFTLNLIVVILMCRHIKLWTPMNMILLNLVCSDLSVSIIGNPITLTASIFQGWIFGRTMCKAYGFFMALLGITSITTLTVLAYERYTLITFPVTSQQLTTRGALIAIFLIWLYSLLLTSPPLFGWGAYVNEAANISCSVNWESQTWNATSYIIFLFFFGLVVPVIVITYSYLKIALTIRQTSKRLGRKSRAERRVATMVAIMIMAFLVAWTPYAIFALISQFGPEGLISPAMGVMPALLAKSSICYNPMIYVGLNTQFRATLTERSHVESTAVVTTDHNEIFSHTSSIAVDCSIKSLRHSKAAFYLKPKTTQGSSPANQRGNDGNSNPDIMNISEDTKTDSYLDSNSNNSRLVEKELTVFADGQISLRTPFKLARVAFDDEGRTT